MKRFVLLLAVFILAVSISSPSLAQRQASPAPRSTYKASKSSSYSVPQKQTYELGGTKYITGQSYKSTGLPKVERSESAKKDFLKSQGFKTLPRGSEVDHVVPLSKGGADKPYNMQLLPKEVHKQKTATERRKK